MASLKSAGLRSACDHAAASLPSCWIPIGVHSGFARACHGLPGPERQGVVMAAMVRALARSRHLAISCDICSFRMLPHVCASSCLMLAESH